MCFSMKKLLEWIRVIHEKYHHPPIFNHPDKQSRFAVCVTGGGAMGAMHMSFSQMLKEDDVVLTDEFIFGGAICCVGLFVLNLFF